MDNIFKQAPPLPKRQPRKELSTIWKFSDFIGKR